MNVSCHCNEFPFTWVSVVQVAILLHKAACGKGEHRNTALVTAVVAIIKITINVLTVDEELR